MPRYASPALPLPDAAMRAVEMFGANSIRGEIIRTLAQNRIGLTSGTIERDLGVSYQTVFRHLQALVALGVVETDGDDEEKHGRRVRYTLNRDVLRTALKDYQAYLLGR